MDVYVDKTPSYISAAKVILAAAGPAQRLLQNPVVTHFMINRQARVILFKDGYKKYADIVDEFLDYLDQGVSWADENFKNMSHFYNPRTLKGLFGWTDAANECNMFWNKAINHWKTVDCDKAFFYIGAAVHLIQDLCVPHHAMGMIFDGHHEYESWAGENRETYRIERGGEYGLGDTPGEWVRKNASIAARHYHLVRAGATLDNYHKATSILLTRAQTSTAGFLHYFLHKMGI